jgi:hypothetical protein
MDKENIEFQLGKKTYYLNRGRLKFQKKQTYFIQNEGVLLSEIHDFLDTDNEILGSKIKTSKNKKAGIHVNVHFV